jgi:hypothetical protein
LCQVVGAGVRQSHYESDVGREEIAGTAGRAGRAGRDRVASWRKEKREKRKELRTKNWELRNSR